MLVKIQNKKNLLSIWVLILFFCVLFISALISDIFQTPRTSHLELPHHQNLFEDTYLNSLKGISLKNNLGHFHLKKNNQDPDTPWHLNSPRQMPANLEKITTLLSILKDIKIKKIFQKDKINIQSFSLDNPSLEISLFDNTGGESILHFGLTNPMNNLTYVTLSTQKAIYHIDALHSSLPNLDYSHFVDSRIFTLNPQNITSLTIFRGKKGKNSLVLQLQKKGENWAGRRGTLLNKTKVSNFIQSIVEIRSLFIIDKKDEKMQKQLQRAIDRPLYTIEIKGQGGRGHQYIASALIGTLPGLKLEKWQNFAMTASNREFPYVLNKKVLKNFSKREGNFLNH